MLKNRPLNTVKQFDNKVFFPALMSIVKDQLKQNNFIANNEYNLRVISSLDIKMQTQTQLKLIQQLTKLEEKYQLKTNSLQAAVIISSTKFNKIEAVVSNRNFNAIGFDRVRNANLQIGSLIKPFIYLTALSKPASYSLVSVLDDSPFTKIYTEFNEKENKEEKKYWSPRNFDGKFHGLIYLFEALAQSYNIATVRLGESVSAKSVLKTMQKLGLTKKIKIFPSMFLGAINLSPLDVANLYQNINGDIKKSTLSAILKITKNNKDLQLKKENKKTGFTKEVLELVKYSMRQSLHMGTALYLKKKMPNLDIAVKTGSTNKFRDSWVFAGGNEYNVVIWLGRDDNKSTGLSGAKGALTIFANIFSDMGFKNLKNNVNAKYIEISKNNNCTNTIKIPYSNKNSKKPVLDSRLGWFMCAK